MRNEIKNQYGVPIGYSQEDGNRIEYFVLGSHGGKIGYWDKNQKQYVSLGLGGCGVTAKSDIGAGHVYQVYVQYNK